MATDTLKFHCFTFRMPNKFLKNIFIKKKKKQKEKKTKQTKKIYSYTYPASFVTILAGREIYSYEAE